MNAANISRFLQPNVVGIPPELRELPRWVTWRAIQSAPGEKPKKVPFAPDRPNTRASSTDPDTWGTFDQAHASFLEGERTGLGFVLNGDGLVGIDLDACVIDGAPSAPALALLDNLGAAYIELSPSGTGLRAFGYAKNLASGCNGTLDGIKVELYSTGRYLTLTGQTIKAGPIGPLRGFAELADRIRVRRKVDPQTGEIGGIAPDEVHAELVRRILSGDVFHDSLRDLAASLVATGMRPGAVVNHLRGLMDASAAPRDDRWRARCAQIRELVVTAEGKYAPPPLDAVGWPDPQPLIVKIDPVEYPLDALPGLVRCAVAEVAGFVKAPIALIATSALAALSLAIQAHVDVVRAEKLSGPTGLFLMAIADSGERKSTCDGFFTKAILDYEEREYEAAKPLVKDYQSANDAWTAKCAGVKEKIRTLAKESKPTADMESALRALNDDKPTPPHVPRLNYADATPEALAYGLAKEWPSGGVISAEAGIVFGSHGMGKESVMRNLAMLNQLWDGNALKIDRRTSESFTVRGARLTMALQVQELTVRAFFDSTNGLARGTGFLARFLVSWPESTQGSRPFTEAPPNWPALAAFNGRLTAILNMPAPIDDRGALIPVMLKLAPDAKKAWVKFHDEIEVELSAGRELFDVRDVASKAADNVARLAALFHTFTGSVGPIDMNAVESAARIVAWHLNESRRFLGELALPPELANPARLDSWLIDYCRREKVDSVPTREVQRCGPGGLRDKGAINDAIKELSDLGRARVVQDGRRKLIEINPALLGEVIP